MKTATYQTIRRLVEDDPMTEAQVKALTDDTTRTLIDAPTAADILGVSVVTVRRLPLPRVKTNRRSVQFRLSDIYRYMDQMSTTAQARAR